MQNAKILLPTNECHYFMVAVYVFPIFPDFHIHYWSLHSSEMFIRRKVPEPSIKFTIIFTSCYYQPIWSHPNQNIFNPWRQWTNVADSFTTHHDTIWL